MVRLGFLVVATVAVQAADLRVGIVGTDTSHVIAFTKVLNDSTSPEHLAGARVVAAYKGGSPDVKDSYTRVDKFAKELEETWKVQMFTEISGMCSTVDAFLLESVDGRKHLPQFREIAKCKKPVFIDKPLSSTLADAREIAKIAKENGVPWFSSSSLRYSDFLKDLKRPGITGAVVWGPGPTEEHHELDLSYYAIHPVEALYTLMGPGCAEVTRVSGATMDEVTCRWKDGRIGTVRALRPYGDYGAVVFFEKDVVQSPPKPKFSYRLLLIEIVKFFESKTPPVPNDETLEIFAMMDAAQRSKAAGGKPTPLR